MTPDESERMERAERIRRLREEDGGGRDRGLNGDTGDGGGDAGEASDDDAGGACGGDDGTDGDRVDGGDEVTTDVAGAASGVELPDLDQMEAVLAGQDGVTEDGADAETVADLDPSEPSEPERATVGASARSVTTTSTARTRVLEFTLGERLYCIDVAGVEEIVERETATRVPNTPEYVEGVVDLRGQITTILDAKRLLDVDDAGPASLVVVFAPDAFEDQGTIGWVVDEVRQVRPVTEAEVRDPPADDDHVEAIVDPEDADELAVWVRPADAIDAVDGDEA